MDDVKTYLNSAEEKMAMAIEFLDEALAHIRAGKANPRILDGIRVDYYGSLTPLSNVANISVPMHVPSLLPPGKNPCSK